MKQETYSDMKLCVILRSAWPRVHHIKMLLVKGRIKCHSIGCPSIFSWENSWKAMYFDKKDHSWADIWSYISIFLKIVYQWLITHTFLYLWNNQTTNFVDTSINENHDIDVWDLLTNIVLEVVIAVEYNELHSITLLKNVRFFPAKTVCF